VQSWLTEHYGYDRQVPLEARVVETTKTAEWRREKIEYRGAAGDRVPAYLYLPATRFRAPYQVVHFIPAGDVGGRFRTVPQAIEADYIGIVQSGRAIFCVVQRGFLERETPGAAHSEDSAEFADEAARDLTDLRRGMDYLETRRDVDVSRAAFTHASAGGYVMCLPAIDSRYRAVVLWGAGIRSHEDQTYPKVNPINLAPLMRAPKLLIHGKYDETTPLKSEFEPFYQLLPEPKQSRFFTGGHRPDHDYFVSEANAFLDEVFGRPK
jgi:hypothetical protein